VESMGAGVEKSMEWQQQQTTTVSWFFGRT